MNTSKLLVLLCCALVAAPAWAQTAKRATPIEPPNPSFRAAAATGSVLGSWWTGTLSTIQYYNPDNGEWAPPNGTGTWFTFNADGSYTAGGVLNVTTYNCTSRLYVYRQGTYRIAQDSLILNQQGGRSLGTVCGGPPYERDVGQETQRYRWRLGPDEYGQQTLTLYQDGELYASYRPWDLGDGGSRSSTTLRLFDPASEQMVSLIDQTAPLDTGFVYGTNVWNDQAKATLFTLPEGQAAGEVNEVSVYFAYRKPGLSNAQYRIEIYDGTAETGPVGEPLYSAAYPYSHIQVDGDPTTPSPATVHPLETAVRVGPTFFISVLVDFDATTGADALAIACTPSVQQRVPEVWERWQDGTWANASDAWWGQGGAPGSGALGSYLWVEAKVSRVVTANETAPDLPARAVLEPGYPNPLNPVAAIPFELRQAGPVRLAVYDLLGREVAVLVEGRMPAGAQQVVWNAAGLPSGTYLVRLTDGHSVQTQSLTLLK